MRFIADVRVDETRYAELKVDREMVRKGGYLIQVTDISYNFGEESDLVELFLIPF